MSTQGISGNELYQRLKDIVVGLKDKPFIGLNAVRFEKNQISFVDDGAKLRQAVDILQRYPGLQVEIGSYAHTGSRLAKSMHMSVKRANAVRDALVKQGIATDRISVASPENNRALINTCSAVPGCDWENTALNGMVEFKITGAKL